MDKYWTEERSSGQDGVFQRRSVALEGVPEMHVTMRRLSPNQGLNPPVKVPDTQLRALERRHALDQQQREFSNSTPATQSMVRSRPPG